MIKKVICCDKCKEELTFMNGDTYYKEHLKGCFLKSVDDKLIVFCPDCITKIIEKYVLEGKY